MCIGFVCQYCGTALITREELEQKRQRNTKKQSKHMPTSSTEKKNISTINKHTKLYDSFMQQITDAPGLV